MNIVDTDFFFLVIIIRLNSVQQSNKGCQHPGLIQPIFTHSFDIYHQFPISKNIQHLVSRIKQNKDRPLKHNKKDKYRQSNTQQKCSQVWKRKQNTIISNSNRTLVRLGLYIRLQQRLLDILHPQPRIRSFYTLINTSNSHNQQQKKKKSHPILPTSYQTDFLFRVHVPRHPLGYQVDEDDEDTKHLSSKSAT